MSKKTTYTAKNFKPLGSKVFVTDMDSGARQTKAGIILADDDMKESGIRHRWAKVWKTGPDVEDVNVGEWVLVEHGRWTNGMDLELEDETILRVWHIDYPAGVLLVSDSEEDPREHKRIKF